MTILTQMKLVQIPICTNPHTHTFPFFGNLNRGGRSFVADQEWIVTDGEVVGGVECPGWLEGNAGLERPATDVAVVAGCEEECFRWVYGYALQVR